MSFILLKGLRSFGRVLLRGYGRAPGLADQPVATVAMGSSMSGTVTMGGAVEYTATVALLSGLTATVEMKAVAQLSSYKIALGAFLDGTSPATIDGYTALIGAKPSHVMFFLFRSNSPAFPTSACNDVRSRNAVPVITWLENINTNAGLALGADDAFLTTWFTAAAAWGHPVYLRYDWEMNIGLNGTPADFIAAWRHIYALSRACGATNIRWIWNPNVEYFGTTDFDTLYPGDAYVDWVALDGYNWGHTDENHWWTQFIDVFGSDYAKLTALTNKPVMIGEVGCADNGGDKAAWISQAFTDVPRHFPGIKAITWFNVAKEQDWRVNSDPAALVAYRNVAASPRYHGLLP